MRETMRFFLGEILPVVIVALVVGGALILAARIVMYGVKIGLGL